MALETWLIKVKETISNTLDTARSSIPNSKASKHNNKSNVGVLCFEIAGLMSKLLHLWNCLSDKNMICLRDESISLEGVRKIVSNDESFMLGLACAEMAESLRLVAKSISRMSKKCQDPNLRCFDRWFDEFANSGHDSHGWVLSSKEMEAKKTKMDKYVTITVALYKEMEDLSTIENGLRKSFQCKEYESSTKGQMIVDLQQKLFWQKQEVKYLKDRSFWNKSFDKVVPMLVTTAFTVLGRMKLVFGFEYPPSLSRTLSASATVHPTENADAFSFVSGPLRSCSKQEEKKNMAVRFFESNSKLITPHPSTLGGSGLALHYANLIIVMEKMIKSLHFVGADARDDLYSMLPSSIRSSLRGSLKGVGFSASDPVLAGEWRAALRNILGWLSPLAHNMIKWQSERSFEHQNLLPKMNVLRLQSLFFADKEKTEAAITELLVGLNYIWRFEREMTAKALFECSNFNGLLNSQSCR
ncbi:putative aminotransferase ACS12-like [Hibiscus syriacus]|uniref:Aminotransferase ACS12-like n=1 Tax=Hibiscus syriacus TaxID=106335 RepID=A0A6A3CKM0_HIBSY|nr:protein PSK SIMULATOR 1-like [Hibiscus syriacus]KAE8729925.1 putative aminotransferase ACS12-like [Hibiscus syriacus]